MEATPAVPVPRDLKAIERGMWEVFPSVPLFQYFELTPLDNLVRVENGCVLT